MGHLKNKNQSKFYFLHLSVEPIADIALQPWFYKRSETEYWEGHPWSTSVRQGICLWWDLANNYPMRKLIVGINGYKFALLPTAYRDKAFLVIIIQFSIGKIYDNKLKTGCQRNKTDYRFLNRIPDFQFPFNIPAYNANKNTALVRIVRQLLNKENN